MASADKFPEVLRKLQIIYACGALTFSSMPGVIADMTGGYIPAYILFSILIFCSLVGIIAAYRESGRKIASSQKTKKVKHPGGTKVFYKCVLCVFNKRRKVRIETMFLCPYLQLAL